MVKVSTGSKLMLRFDTIVTLISLALTRCKALNTFQDHLRADSKPSLRMSQRRRPVQHIGRDGDLRNIGHLVETDFDVATDLEYIVVEADR